jgi:hypothetical protein
MSSVIGLRHSNAAFDWTTSKASCTWENQRDTLDSLSFRRYHSDNESSVRSGLPTPPSTRAMNGVTLRQQPSHNTTSQPYQSSRFPLHNVPNNNLPHQRDGRDNLHHGDMQVRTNGFNSGHRTQGSQDRDISTSKSTTNAIASHLQIPESVNKSKGSLAEFAAEVGGVRHDLGYY